MNEVMNNRGIEQITTEINVIKAQTQKIVLTNAIEIGRRLVEVKSMLPHGEWGKYLEEQVEYSQSTADNLMKLYREYGSDQASLFDSFANSQAFANLTYSKALALLALPAEERETFVEENDVEAASTRDLQELIRQRTEELEAVKEKNALYTEAVENAVSKLEAAQAEAEQAQQEKKAAEEKAEKLQQDLSKARDKEKAARAELKQLKENPNVPGDVMASIRKEAEEQAAKASKEELEKKLAAAQRQVEQAQRVAAETEEKLVAAQKAVKLASPEAAVFKVRFEQVQKDFTNLQVALMDVKEADPATGTQLEFAVKKLLEKWNSELEGQ